MACCYQLITFEDSANELITFVLECRVFVEKRADSDNCDFVFREVQSAFATMTVQLSQIEVAQTVGNWVTQL